MHAAFGPCTRIMVACADLEFRRFHQLWPIVPNIPDRAIHEVRSQHGFSAHGVHAAVAVAEIIITDGAVMKTIGVEC